MPSPSHHTLIHAFEDLSRAQREAGARIARSVECTRGGLAVVRILARGSQGVGELAALLRVDVSVASRQVAALVDAGLVERDVPATDRRTRTVALTAAGHALADRASAATLDLAAAMFADWSAAELDAAADQFRRVTAAVVRHHGPPTASTTRTPSAPSPEREIA